MEISLLYRIFGSLCYRHIQNKRIYASVARMKTVRLVTAIASSKSWIVCQFDVKSIFLTSPLEEDVCILQPPRFEIKGKESLVWP